MNTPMCIRPTLAVKGRGLRVVLHTYGRFSLEDEYSIVRAHCGCDEALLTNIVISIKNQTTIRNYEVKLYSFNSKIILVLYLLLNYIVLLVFRLYENISI